jgi:hypothetical protein
MNVFETEVYIAGNLHVETLKDHDDYVTVGGVNAARG